MGPQVALLYYLLIETITCKRDVYTKTGAEVSLAKRQDCFTPGTTVRGAPVQHEFSPRKRHFQRNRGQHFVMDSRLISGLVPNSQGHHFPNLGASWLCQEEWRDHCDLATDMRHLQGYIFRVVEDTADFILDIKQDPFPRCFSNENVLIASQERLFPSLTLFIKKLHLSLATNSKRWMLCYHWAQSGRIGYFIEEMCSSSEIQFH